MHIAAVMSAARYIINKQGLAGRCAAPVSMFVVRCHGNGGDTPTDDVTADSGTPDTALCGKQQHDLLLCYCAVVF